MHRKGLAGQIAGGNAGYRKGLPADQKTALDHRKKRFEKIAGDTPVFDQLHQKYGSNFGNFLAEKIEVIEGDVSRPGLGIDDEDVRIGLLKELDLIINSSGLTDFNPDLRQALSINVDGTINLLNYLRECDHAALLHLSTCYVVGFQNGRIQEELKPDYNPKNNPDFNAENEYEYLLRLAAEIEAASESEEVTEELRRQVSGKGRTLSDTEMASQIRKQRQRRVRDELIEAGMRRANEHGWPNTYTFTKSLAESLIGRLGADLPISIVRPSIVETSTHEPFEGWNEGVNTSAPISYLLGTFFRQMPTNGKKCLDIVPVDLVCRGMILISAALIARKHELMYQLATSAVNPCNMRTDDRTHRAGSSQTLQGPGRFQSTGAGILRHHSGFQGKVSETFGSASETDHSVPAMDPFTAPNGTVPARQTPERSRQSRKDHRPL
ncbi:MAG: SDR family oxidoreductase [Acidobacteria bacterium]|nr:SDR family oxidoreductase [Acidobacteriota bacterium]